MRIRRNGWYRWGAFGALTVLLVAGAMSVAAQTTSVKTFPAIIGQQTSFTGTGFSANENVSLWTTGPDRSVVALAGQQADGNGSLSVSVSFSSSGFWQVTAHGIDSTHETISGYAVTSTADAATATVTSGDTAGVGTQPSATRTTPNQSVGFTGVGFAANEHISLWTTSPTGVVTALDSTFADANGKLNVAVVFGTTGFWQVTAHGIDTNHEIIGAYQVGDPAAVNQITTAQPVASSATPVTSASSSTVSYTSIVNVPAVNSSLVTPSAAQLTPPSRP